MNKYRVRYTFTYADGVQEKLSLIVWADSLDDASDVAAQKIDTTTGRDESYEITAVEVVYEQTRR